MQRVDSPESAASANACKEERRRQVFLKAPCPFHSAEDTERQVALSRPICPTEVYTIQRIVPHFGSHTCVAGKDAGVRCPPGENTQQGRRSGLGAGSRQAAATDSIVTSHGMSEKRGVPGAGPHGRKSTLSQPVPLPLPVTRPSAAPGSPQNVATKQAGP